MYVFCYELKNKRKKAFLEKINHTIYSVHKPHPLLASFIIIHSHHNANFSCFMQSYQHKQTRAYHNMNDDRVVDMRMWGYELIDG